MSRPCIMEGHRNCFGHSLSRPSAADDEASGWAKKTGHTCCGRVKESAGRTLEACDRGYVDGADGGRAREHVKITPIGDGVARRVGARSEEREKGGGHTLPAASVGLGAVALVFWSKSLLE